MPAALVPTVSKVWALTEPAMAATATAAVRAQQSILIRESLSYAPSPPGDRGSGPVRCPI